jgi:hypothetical protein
LVAKLGPAAARASPSWAIAERPARRGSWPIEHLGSAHSAAEVELLNAIANHRVAGGRLPDAAA